MAETGLVFDDTYLDHLEGLSGHPDSPDRLRWIGKGLKDSGLIEQLKMIAPRAATPAELTLAHERDYLELVDREAAGLEGFAELSTGDTVVSSRSLAVARLATGGVLAVADGVMQGEVANAFCAVRPPGHHATASRAMGFCIFNHVAVAARYLQRHHGLDRVLIVDWDYHHGNGTQDIFYDDGSVFYFSTHHYGAYPGTGAAGDTGAGDGEGTTMNVPLPVGATDEQLLAALRDRLVPAATGFRPDFILISSGFDAQQRDLLGRFDVTPGGFAAATRILTGLAVKLCAGRIVSVLEGGYRLDGLSACVVAHAGALLDAAVPAH